MTETGPSGTSYRSRRHHRVRSGDEPLHARSPLRLRLTLALTGLANGLAGVILFALLGNPPLAWAFAALGAIALINAGVVVHHIRQGPHYQPGPGIPPYRPLPPFPEPGSQRPYTRPTASTRHRRYLLMMGVCVILIVLAWSWVRLYSVGAAVAMSAAAAIIPPFAAILSNAGSPILHEGDEGSERDERDERNGRGENDPPG